MHHRKFDTSCSRNLGCGTFIALTLNAASTMAAAASGDDRTSLTNDWFGHATSMREAGLTLRADWNQFSQGMANGGGQGGAKYGGQFDVLARIDLSQVGLWEGAIITGQGIYNYGQTANNLGGSLLYVNLPMKFPGESGSDSFDVTALYLTQAVSDSISLSVGKINLVEVARGTPLRGGATAVDTFWNVNLAAPISGLSPPTIFGAMARISADPVSVALFAYDAADATNGNVFDNPFATGINFMGTASYKTRVAGRLGIYGLKGVYSTKRGIDFKDVDQILLPPEARDINMNKGSWYLGVSAQQYIHHDPNDPSRGWGVFGEIAASDGNPNVLQWSGYLGVGGTSFIPGREADRFGVGAFRFSPSRDLKNGLAGLFNLEDEAGVEAFYSWSALPWLRITADVQYVDPASGDYDDGIFVGLGSNVRF